MIAKGIACASLITLIAGAMLGLDSYFARKDTNQQVHQFLRTKVQLVAIRLDQQIYYDKIEREQGLLRDYEEQYGEDCVNAPASKKSKCDRAVREIKNAEDELEKVPEMVEKTY